MPVKVISSKSTQAITVNALIQNPLMVPERIIQILDDQFVMDQVLRNAGQATGGAVMFRVSSSLFADDDAEIVNEFSEIPVATVSRGDISSAPVKKAGLAVVVSREMRQRNALGDVNNQIARVKNTFLRFFDGRFADTLLGAITQVVPASQPWTSTSATIRKNINAARKLVKMSLVPNASANDFSGYVPDTIMFNPNVEEELLNSTEFLSLIFGTTAPTNVATIADAPNGILGLKPKINYGMPDGEAVVFQSKVVGGYADEFPLESTELYEQLPNQTWRSDTTRSTVGFIDNPGAAATITGI